MGEVGEGERREGEEMGPMMRIVEREEGEREGEREGEEDEGMGVRSLFSELSEDYSDLSAFGFFFFFFFCFFLFLFCFCFYFVFIFFFV